MGKGSKKKGKQKKADFQKVKFKVGKKIAKGNVVDTTFKTKKISIKEQLKAGSPTDGGGTTVAAKRDIQEILKHVCHLHPSVRINALIDLREALIARPELSAVHLSVIIGRTTSLCVDNDSTVRKAAIALLRHLFSSVPFTSLVPHLHVIVAHVRCALSHISHDVRASALQVVDQLVDDRIGASAEVARFSGRLLLDFVDQISSRDGSARRSQPSDGSKGLVKRALSSDPSCSITSAAWHLQVSRRLRAILRNILRSQVNDAPGGQPEQLVAYYDSKTPLHVPLLFKTAGFPTADSVSRMDLDELFEDENQIQVLFDTLIPLLFEMWVEAHSLDSGIALKLVSGESLEVYSCIVDVIQLLWKLMDFRHRDERKLMECWFDENFEKRFLAHCMAAFPYSDHTAPLRKKGKKEAKECTPTRVQDAFALNLSLCYIATCLNSFKTSPTSWLPSIWKYVMKFVEGDGWSASHADTVVHVLGKFLECKCEQSHVLLIALHKLCWRLPVYRAERKHLLELLGELVTLPIYAHHHHSDGHLWTWVASLPAEILKYDAEIPRAILKIIQCVCYRGQTEFLSNVRSHLPAIFDYILRHSSNDSDWERDFKLIANLLYWVPEVDKNLFSKVAQVYADRRLSARHRAYVFHVLDDRFQRQINGNGRAWCKRSEYVSFLSSIKQIDS